METKKISDFAGFQCSASVLDQIKGGQRVAVIDDQVYTGEGINGSSGHSCRDMMFIFSDDSWITLYYDLPY